MYKLDDNFLIEVGLGALPAHEKPEMIRDIYNKLELKVGMRLAEQMTDAQLDEFEGLIDQKNDAASLQWLERNFPNYKQVVADELEKLKVEVRSSAPHILAVFNQAPPQAA